MEAARTQCAHRECTHRVGTTYIELLAIRHLVAIAIGKSTAHKDASHELRFFREATSPHELSLQLGKL